MFEFRCESCGHQTAVEETMAGTTTVCEHCQVTMQIPFPPLELPQQVTSGGSVVHLHEPAMSSWQPALGNDTHIERIADHIETHLGEIETVWHELVSDLVHIDIHCIAPTEDRPFRTLVTSGMSERRMHVPDDALEYRYLELMICLPPDWPVTQEALADENHYWPIRGLKRLARFPHQYDTWLFYGHTVPNGEPPAPLAQNNQFTGWLLMPPQLAPDLFLELEINEQTSVHFAALYPLYDAEMQLKLDAGTEVLFERMIQNGVTELVDVDRKNVAIDDYGALD